MRGRHRERFCQLNFSFFFFQAEDGIRDRKVTGVQTRALPISNAASVTVYLKNQSDFAAMNEVYRTYWTKDPPARTTVMLPLLNEGLVEIAVAAVPNGGRSEERRVGKECSRRGTGVDGRREGE